MSSKRTKTSSRFATSTPALDISPPSKQLWIARDTLTKGRGIFATCHIKKGTLILLEFPSATTNVSSQHMTRHDVDQALNHFTATQHVEYNKLSDHGGSSSDKKVRIFQTNGISLGDDRVALLFNVSLINHSCVPNAKWAYRKETGKFFVTACTDIREGAEICTNYMPFAYLYTSAQRNAILEDVWKFKCDCEACSDTSSGSISDMRRVLLFGLQKMLDGDANKLVNYNIASKATGGKDSCTVVTLPRSDADRIRLWWLTAKLLEAEGIYDEVLGNAYAQAFTMLQARMLELGLSDTPPVPVEAYSKNIKDWMKATLDVFKVSRRSNGHIVYAGPGEDGIVLRNFQEKGVKYAGQAQLYDEEGETRSVNIKPEDVKYFLRQGNPGEDFCQEYMQRFGHLYR